MKGLLVRLGVKVQDKKQEKRAFLFKRSCWSLPKKMVSATRCDQGVMFSSCLTMSKANKGQRNMHSHKKPGPWVCQHSLLLRLNDPALIPSHNARSSHYTFPIQPPVMSAPLHHCSVFSLISLLFLVWVCKHLLENALVLEELPATQWPSKLIKKIL